MSVKIRLKRHGGRKRPFYRIVVSDSRSPRDGKFIEQVGTYDPKAASGGVKLDREKVDRWLQRGAAPTQTVSEIIKRERRSN
jgi:small subunit ribosomal protein S16